MKFIGKIGFWLGDKETSPGVFVPGILERSYTGDVHRFTHQFRPEENKQNVNFTVSNQISILLDLYMQQNWPSVRYILWNGVRWSVNRIDIEYPRIKIEIGGIYNE